MIEKEIVYEIDKNDPNIKQKLKKFLEALQENNTYYQPFKRVIKKR